MSDVQPYHQVRESVHVIMSLFQGISRILHCLQHSRVRVCTLQGLPLHFNRREGAVDLLQLLLVLLLALEGSDGH